MDQDLAERVAVITGAARGIGRATAELLASHGAKVVIADVDGQGAEVTAKALRDRALKAVAVAVDVSDRESVESLIRTAVDAWGKVDILVNNAGIIDPKNALEVSEADWDRVIDVNLKSVHLCSQAATREMMKNGYGRIVNIGSVAGRVGGLKVGPDYAASKAGVICLAKSYARFGAQYGINANAVAPGFIETDMTRGRDDPSEVPVNRLGTPEDVAKVVYFLVSPLADYVTGTCIDVNGGIFMG
jgi:3-oxoacyl-[acyl-carrier protein] reductase